MANRIGSEEQSPSRPPIRLLGSVLLLGTLLAWWGTRDHRHLFGESLRKPVVTAGVVLPQVTQERTVLIERGSQISQRQCAGCHEMATRYSAPSYQEIVTFYRREVATFYRRQIVPVDDRQFTNLCGNPDLLSRLASAVTHPRPGWGNFAPGPLESELSLHDRIALASWILNSLDRDKNAAGGLGK
jgi:hypothetical protein